jgi:hypothetical protein
LLTGFTGCEWSNRTKAREFARWLGRSESLLRNVDNRIVPLSANLARRISERTGVSESWLLSDSPENDPILDRHGDIWDPVRLLDPLVLGDHDFRNALPIAPQLLLQLAQAIIEVACLRGLHQGDTTLLVSLMDLVKRQIDLNDPQFATALTEKLQSPESAEVLQLWHLASLAAKHKRNAQGGSAARSEG